jgi:hypothetical protein|nr:MAG TPA: hypothetical protein [Caudoviricetes sp.]
MAEFLTMDEAEDKFGTKGRTNAALTLGIIGTALGAFTGNNELEKKEVATATALPLMFELSRVKSEKYTDDCCCKAEKQNLISDAYLQRQLDTKITGELKYAYNNLCAPVPNISPLYCSPFTTYGSGTTWTGCCNGSGNCQGQ